MSAVAKREQKAAPVQAASPAVKNAHAAPVIYFDDALTFGHVNGVIQVELSTNIIHFLAENKTLIDRTSAAHLRCSAASARALRQAIDQALAMVEQAQAMSAHEDARIKALKNGFDDYQREETSQRKPS